jgi:hypothetical protein
MESDELFIDGANGPAGALGKPPSRRELGSRRTREVFGDAHAQVCGLISGSLVRQPLIADLGLKTRRG